MAPVTRPPSRGAPPARAAAPAPARKSAAPAYRERTQDDVKRQVEQRAGNYDSYISTEFSFFKPQKGINRIRILQPTWSDDELDIWGRHYGIEIWLHNNIGPDNATYLCPKKMADTHKGFEPDGGVDCCLCNARRDFEAAGETEDAKALAPKKRWLVWILDRAQESEGPLVWSMPWTLDKDVCSRLTNKRTGAVLPIDHPDDGYDVSFTREGEKKRTNYIGVDIDRDPSNMCDTQEDQDEFLQFIADHSLPSILVFHPQEYIEQVFGGQVNRPDEDLGDQAEKPAGREDRSRGATRRSVRDPEPEPEPEQPRRSTRVGRQPAAAVEPEPETRRPARRPARQPDPEPEPEEEAPPEDAAPEEEPPPEEPAPAPSRTVSSGRERLNRLNKR